MRTIKTLIISALLVIIMSASLMANASSLSPRLGGLAYYDDDANLTWLADTNYASTSNYDLFSNLYGWYWSKQS